MAGGLWTTRLVILVGALSIAAAVGSRFTGVDLVRALLFTPAAALSGALWQLVTYGAFLPLYGAGSIFYFLITLFFFYSIGSQVEFALGSRRYIGFLVSLLVLSAILTIPVAYLLDAERLPQSGIWVVLGGLTLLFARTHAHQPIHLFFVLPVRGQQLVWITFGIWILAALLEGLARVLPEGFGLLLAFGFANGAFTPRRTWLRMRAWWIERQLKRRSSRFSVIRGGKDEEKEERRWSGRRKDGGPWLH